MINDRITVAIIPIIIILYITTILLGVSRESISLSIDQFYFAHLHSGHRIITVGVI